MTDIRETAEARPPSSNATPDGPITRVVSSRPPRPDPSRPLGRHGRSRCDARLSVHVRKFRMTSFTDFGLAEPILKALAAEGYETPTPIQAQAIPHVMAGRDLCGIAQTGTGKTAAFALPILHRLAANPKAPCPQGLPRPRPQPDPRACRARSPTASAPTAATCASRPPVVFGGVADRQAGARALDPGVDVLVATPGRLLDLIDRRSLTLREVEILVLDEADQMLDLGFIHALKRIVDHAAEGAPDAVLLGHHAEDHLDAGRRLPARSGEGRGGAGRDHRRAGRRRASCSSRPGASWRCSRRSSGDPAVERVLVFTRTKHGADKVVRGLEKAGIAGAAIHGNKSQPAARAGARRLPGRLVPGAGGDRHRRPRHRRRRRQSHVINYDLPNVPESYVHRIGRTARAGAAGHAISFCNDEERAYLARHREADPPDGAGGAAAGRFRGGRDRRADAPIPQRGGGRPQPHARGAKPQGHGASRQNDAGGERGPKGRRRRGGGQGAGPAAAPAHRQGQGRPAHAGSGSQGSSARPLASTQPFRRSDARNNDGGQVSWLDKGPRRS